MASVREEPSDFGDRGIFSSDVWISEKRGMSLARDPQTGLLLTIEERERNEEQRRGNRLPPRLRRVLRGKKSRAHRG